MLCIKFCTLDSLGKMRIKYDLKNRKISDQSIIYLFFATTMYTNSCLSIYTYIRHIFFFLNFNFTDTELLYGSYVTDLGTQHVSYMLYTTVELRY